MPVPKRMRIERDLRKIRLATKSYPVGRLASCPALSRSQLRLLEPHFGYDRGHAIQGVHMYYGIGLGTLVVIVVVLLLLF